MKFLTAIAAAWVAALLVGCGDPGSSVPSPVTAGTNGVPGTPMPPKTQVTLVMKTLTNPFFIEMEKGARKAQQELGIDLQVKTATQETSIEQQVQLVEQAIQDKTQAIVIAPGDSLRLVPVLKKAQDAGVHIVNIDNRLSPDAMHASGMKPVPFISVDNERGAYDVTRSVMAKLPGPASAAVIEGIRTADNAQQRKRGAERAFAENPKVRVVASETANWKIDEAYQVAQVLFKKHPNVSLVFCANDMMAIGVINYLQETRKTHVRVIGFDALQEAKTAIKAGQMAATVNQQADQQGYLGVKTAVDLIRGQRPEIEITVAAKVVDATTLD